MLIVSSVALGLQIALGLQVTMAVHRIALPFSGPRYGDSNLVNDLVTAQQYDYKLCRVARVSDIYLRGRCASRPQDPGVASCVRPIL